MDLHTPSNFTMLTECLYTQFKRYIINGRVRAPPEFDLFDMIPTFLSGAKTDRRALQSKFKSWAKRMTVENGKLLLSSSRKIIIPEERCDNLIMDLHSDDHLSIEQVILKIQQKYTWTKKNFGMDRETVKNAITTHCENAECRRGMKKTLSSKDYSRWNFRNKYTGSFIPYMPYGSGSPDSFYCTVPRPFDWSVGVPPGNVFSPSNYFPHSTFGSIPPFFPAAHSFLPVKQMQNSAAYGNEPPSPVCRGLIERQKRDLDKYQQAYLGNVKKNYHQPLTRPLTEKCVNKIPKSMMYRSARRFKSEDQLKQTAWESQNGKENYHETSRPNSYKERNVVLENVRAGSGHSRVRLCKKPKNLHDFAVLMKSARMNPREYPEILTATKTQFLSTLGLVPKRVCTKHTLHKFRKELRKRLLAEKHRGRLADRKILRDRNKLNKKHTNRIKVKYQSYLHVSKSCSSESSQGMDTPGKYNPKNSVCGTTRQEYHIQECENLKPEPNYVIPAGQRVHEVVDITSSEQEEQNGQNRKIEELSATTTDSNHANEGEAECALGGKILEHSQARGGAKDGMECQGTRRIPGLFINQNGVLKIAMPCSSFQPKQTSLCAHKILQQGFRPIRPFLIPATSSGEVAVVQSSRFPMTKPIRQLKRPTLLVNPYPVEARPLKEDIQVPDTAQQGNAAVSQPSAMQPSKSLNVSIQKASTSSPSHEVEKNPGNFKIYLVNKTPNGTILLVPPYCATVRNDNVLLARNQPIAPRTQGCGSIPLNVKFPFSVGISSKRQSEMLNTGALSNCTSNGRESFKKDIHGEMAKLSNFITKMKDSCTRDTFRRDVQKPVDKLTAQLDIGISLVRKVRKALLEAEKFQQLKEYSEQVSPNEDLHVQGETSSTACTRKEKC